MRFLFIALLISSCGDDVHHYNNKAEDAILQVVKCESKRYSYKECTLPTPAHSVVTLVQHSKTPCVKDTNYGFLNENVLYVDEGCRATFVLSNKEK